MCFTKILIEHVPKNHIGKHLSTQTKPLVVCIGEKKSVCVSVKKTEICCFVDIHNIVSQV